MLFAAPGVPVVPVVPVGVVVVVVVLLCGKTGFGPWLLLHEYLLLLLPVRDVQVFGVLKKADGLHSGT